MHQALLEGTALSRPPHLSSVGGGIITSLILQERKPRGREVKVPAQGHTANPDEPEGKPGSSHPHSCSATGHTDSKSRALLDCFLRLASHLACNTDTFWLLSSNPFLVAFTVWPLMNRVL